MRCPPVSSRMRARAARSDSTSCSTNSHPRHSSHSRISRVCGQLPVPKSSSTGMFPQLQVLANHVVDRRLHFLNSRYVVTGHDQREIRKTAAADLAAVVAKQGNGQQLAFASLFERSDNVARSAAGRNSDGNVLGAGLRDELAEKYQIGSDIVGH